MTELCRQYGISRKTGYKWVRRFEQGGELGLQERSHAPLTRPNRTDEEVCQALLAFRRDHPTWGPRKILCVLAQQQPALADRLPAPSTVGDLLQKAGLVLQSKRRRRPEHPGASPLGDPAPNAIWCPDYKGDFDTGDSRRCYPLTVTDAASRYVLCCRALPSTAHELARQTLESLFVGIGLPEAIRTDNGVPFCSLALGGLSRLSVWRRQLGIVHQRIRPASPQENGRHERMHRTLKAETLRPPAQNRECQQERFAAFMQEYNTVRPHEALGMQTPASRWQPPTRAMPAQLRAPDYPGHMQIRRVRSNGEIKFRGRLLFVSEVPAGHTVAMDEIDDGLWSPYFFDTLPARLDKPRMKLSAIRRAVGGIAPL